MPITKPTVSADAYLEADSEDLQPKVGTTVQEGWDAFDALTTRSEGDFPIDFKFSEEPVLVLSLIHI